jgi:hypothetical protein
MGGRGEVGRVDVVVIVQQVDAAGSDIADFQNPAGGELILDADSGDCVASYISDKGSGLL